MAARFRLAPSRQQVGAGTRGRRRGISAEAGAASIDYAVIASIMAAVVIAGLTLAGPRLAVIFANLMPGLS